MKNHLEALNESFNKINIENTSAKLFEDFTGDESESGIDKEDILDWLSDHEQLWTDCERHFHTDPNWLSADELESFICEHEQACKDYARAFGFSLEENLKESYSSIINHLNDTFEEILNDGYSLSDMNDIVKEELREFIRSYKAAHKHEE